MTRDAAEALDLQHPRNGDALPLRDGLRSDAERLGQLGAASGQTDSKGGECLAHNSEHKHGLIPNASIAFVTLSKAALTMPAMTNELGKRIRAARKAKGLTLDQVAKALGLSYPAVQQWETGKTTPTAENLMRLQSVVGVDLLASDAPAADSRQRPSYDEPNATWEQGPFVVRAPVLGPADIEELGVTVGGDGEDDAAFELNGQVIDYVRRPPGIIGRKNVFALRVSNSSMEPKFDDGERVFVERRRPVVRDFVVVELNPLEDGSPGKSFIKRLVGMDATKITVEQYNPRGLLEFGRHEIKNLFRVIPEKELRGES